MILLVVDDDRYVLEDIKKSLDYTSLGISEIYSALNICEAKDLLNNHSVDIVISDIDMPGGNGLELLSYIKNAFPKIQTFFITCHADFNFAKQAIHLGCLDYLLKPLDYKEVENIIKTAIARIEENQENDNLKAIQSHWFKHQPRLIEQFWKDIINRKIPLSQEFLEREADRRNIPFQTNVTFIPIMICIQYDEYVLTIEEASIISFGIQNIGEEFLTNWGEFGHFFEITARTILGMFPIHENSIAVFQQNINSKLAEYVSICHNYLSANISCYVGSPILIFELPDMFAKLYSLNENNVAYFNQVFYLKHPAHSTAAAPGIDMLPWSTFIKKGYYSQVSSEIHQLFEDMVANKTIDYKFCIHFQQDFLQLIYMILRENGISAHLILEDKDVLKLYKDAAHSYKRLLNWIDAVLFKIGKNFTEMDKTALQLQRAISFMIDNFDKDISREEVANHVYLNPDYLDRLFKKHYQVSVSKYILMERMKLAKQLLVETKLSIGEIGAQLGYNNLSNFSRAFKKVLGKNPAEYRKNTPD